VLSCQGSRYGFATVTPNDTAGDITTKIEFDMNNLTQSNACTAPDCLDQRLASCRLLGFPSLAGLVRCESAQLFEPPGAVV